MPKFIHFCSSDTTEHLINLNHVLRFAWDEEVITIYYSNGSTQKLTWTYEPSDQIDVLDDEHFQDLTREIETLFD
jgi:hypothetical protein